MKKLQLELHIELLLSDDSKVHQSLKRLKINSENKVIFQKAIFKKNKIEYIDLVEVIFEK